MEKKIIWVLPLLLYIIVPVFGKHNANLAVRNEKSASSAYSNPDGATELSARTETKDQHRFTTDLIQSGRTLFEAGVYSEAAEKLREAERYLPGFSDKRLISNAYYYLGQLAWIEKKVGAAEHYFEQAFEIAYSIKTRELLGIAAGYLQVLDTLNKLDPALQIYRQATRQLGTDTLFSLDSELAFYNAAIPVLIKAHATEPALEAVRKAALLQDSRARLEREEELQSQRQKYKAEVWGKQNLLLKKEKQLLLRTIAFLIIIGSVIVLGILGWYLLIRNKHALKMQQQAADMEKVLLEKRTQELELEIERRQVREKEALIVSQKQELYQTLLEQASLKEKISRFKDELMRSGLGKIKGLDQLEENAYWGAFIEKFKFINPVFMSRLSNRYPTLSQSELIFCSLIKLNLSTKEISSLLNVSQNSLNVKKFRIRTKMQLQGPAFEQMIRSIDESNAETQ